MNNEKQNLSLMLILAIFVSFISPLIFYLTQKEVSQEGRKLIVDALNFEFTIFIILFVMAIIPFVGLLTVLVGPAFFIVNLIVCLSANNALGKDTPYKFPFGFDIFK